MTSMTTTTDEHGTDCKTPATGLCPTWCNKPAGHEYDSTSGAGDELAFHRYHSSVADWDHEPACRVEALETHCLDGLLEVDEPSIAVYSESGAQMTASGARILARQLLQAAELIDELRVDRG